MSFHRFLSEINSSVWLLDPRQSSNYKKILDTILSGGFMNETKPEMNAMMGTRENLPNGESRLINKVAVVDFVGALTKNGGPCSYGALDIASNIQRLNDDPELQGFIFFFDGPGGSADAYPVFQQLATKITKPVVGLIDQACSLHYWTAVTLCDRLMMTNDLTAEVGSVGALISFDKEMKDIIIVTAPESYDKAADFIAAQKDDHQLLKDKLSTLAKPFMGSVKKLRPNIPDEALHGKVYGAKEAIKLGMVDSMGDMDKAYSTVLTLAKLKTLK